MLRISVVDEPPEPGAPERIGALDYLLSPTWARLGGVEVENLCSPGGMFSRWAYVDRFARARGHQPARPRAGTVGRADGPLGLLYSPDLGRHPCTRETLLHLEALAAGRGISTRWLTWRDLDAVDALGALFIRDDTSSVNHTFDFARRAAARGIPVIDAPEAIEAASDKALEAELFALHGLPVPETRLMHAGNLQEVVDRLGYPFVLKRVDGSFSHEVWRIDGPEDLARRAPVVLHDRLFAVAQAYRPSDFDWRIGLLGGELIFAARYMQVPGHWQVSHWDGDTYLAAGATAAVPLAEVPAEVAEVARAAGAVLGEGLLGVDLKALAEGVVVIEVNDCADLDVGCEDAAEGDGLYHRLLDALGYG